MCVIWFYLILAFLRFSFAPCHVLENVLVGPGTSVCWHLSPRVNEIDETERGGRPLQTQCLSKKRRNRMNPTSAWVSWSKERSAGLHGLRAEIVDDRDGLVRRSHGAGGGENTAPRAQTRSMWTALSSTSFSSRFSAIFMKLCVWNCIWFSQMFQEMPNYTVRFPDMLPRLPGNPNFGTRKCKRSDHVFEKERKR